MAADYEKLYLYLFNCITDALEELEKGRSEMARLLLVRAAGGRGDVCRELWESSVMHSVASRTLPPTKTRQNTADLTFSH